MLSSFLFLTVEADITVPIYQWQQKLMDIVLMDISTQGLNELSAHSRTDHCDLHGRIFLEGLVTHIHMNRRPYGNFIITALPPTTTHIELTICKQTFQFNTHALPPRLQVLVLSTNNIYGTLNCGCLPVKLEVLNVMQNRLTGTIDLTSLPRPIKTFFVSHNCFHQHTVWYDNLPENLKAIGLIGGGSFDAYWFTEIRAVFPDNTVKDKHIFVFVKPKRIF
uniref:Uncharacterized protein n=1 Tax=Paramoeba aestuarina TaxID=180227 RepID=A0A7S4L1A0_9EUKA|mmetsp:Transcript_29747/g.45993  ORF Transcript_29747/g.45993 Transcript_29747/m.45993 type:complete len:221 (+) Transcript_29747:25-687(+)